MWIICQIGAREHYAIPRALNQVGELTALVTDFWVEPGSMLARLPGGRRLKDRFHPGLDGARVIAPNLRMLGFEAALRLRQRDGWDAIQARNALFQRQSLKVLGELESRTARRSVPTLFSYSYAARDLFRYAKARGWRTVLGQIDPGPEEERIVAAEHKRYPHLASSWKPVPAQYWESWREELKLADEVIVNSEWSRGCLLKVGLADEKVRVLPLVYARGPESGPPLKATVGRDAESLKVLFLGQINLRKGVGRLLDAMRLLKNESVELTLAGPTEIDPSAWADLPNVRWVGPIPRSKVAEYYRSSDLFILPTLSDGYALTQLEALSHGLPVLASAHCGAAVTPGMNGWLLDDLEPSTIAQAIRSARDSGRLEKVQAPEFGLRELAAELQSCEKR